MSATLHQLPLDPVRVMRTNRTGAPDSDTAVNCPVPAPLATAVLQDVPSELTLTD